MKDRKFASKKNSENEHMDVDHCAGSKDKKDGCLTYTDPVHGNNFLKKLYELYKREELCDVKLLVGGRFINTHKSVLVSNSSYFEGNTKFFIIYIRHANAIGF